jgi:hypothetical protein
MPEDRLQFSVSTKFTTYARLGLPLMAIMSPSCELFDLFASGIALDVRKLTPKTFDAWVTAFNENAYQDYLGKHFNAALMGATLRGAEAFLPR